MKELEYTFTIEIKRLYEKAAVEPLSKEDVDKLVKLTNAWKSYVNNPVSEDKDSLEGLSDDELLELVRNGDVEY